MTAPGHPLDSRDCKQPGCPDEARYDRGVAAGYCEAHGRPLMQEAGRRGGQTKAANAATPAPASSMEQLVRELATAARRFDRAQAAYHTARAHLEDAGRAFHTARQALDHAAAAALRGPRED